MVWMQHDCISNTYDRLAWSHEEMFSRFNGCCPAGSFQVRLHRRTPLVSPPICFLSVSFSAIICLVLLLPWVLNCHLLSKSFIERNGAARSS